MDNENVATNTEAPAPQGWINPDGSFGNLDTAPENIKTLVSSKKLGSVGDLANSYAEMESYSSKIKNGGLQLPSELSGDDMKAIHSVLGVPETIDGYEFAVPDGVTVQDEILSKFKEFAHSKNLPKGTAQDLLDFEIDISNGIMQAMEDQQTKAVEDSVAQLKDEWKENYDPNFKKAKTGAEKLGLLDFFEELGIADDARVIKKMYEMDSKLSDDTLNAQPRNAAPPKDEEVKEIAESKAFRDRGHPDHKKVMARFLELHNVAG
jgi:hypothetical protein